MAVLEDDPWVVLHGDSAVSSIWAVFDDDGATFDLTGWAVFAQARDDEDDTTPQFTWSVGNGIDIGNARVEIGGRPIHTSTIQLYMRPADFNELPRRYQGVVDVEVASDNTDSPEQRHTIVRFSWRIDPDVTR